MVQKNATTAQGRETSINCQLFTLGHNPEPSSKPKTKNLHKGI